MTTADHPQPDTPEAVAAAEDLEERFIEGEDISPDEIESAAAAASRSSWLARLEDRRRARQAEKAAERERQDKVDGVNRDARALADVGEDELAEKYAAAEDALRAFAAAANERNEALRDLDRRMQSLGSRGHLGDVRRQDGNLGISVGDAPVRSMPVRGLLGRIAATVTDGRPPSDPTALQSNGEIARERDVPRRRSTRKA